MPSEDIPVGRIELEKRPLQSTLNFVNDRQAIEELRDMLQAIIDHLGVPYTPKDSAPKGKKTSPSR